MNVGGAAKLAEVAMAKILPGARVAGGSASVLCHGCQHLASPAAAVEPSATRADTRMTRLRLGCHAGRGNDDGSFIRLPLAALPTRDAVAAARLASVPMVVIAWTPTREPLNRWAIE